MSSTGASRPATCPSWDFGDVPGRHHRGGRRDQHSGQQGHPVRCGPAGRPVARSRRREDAKTVRERRARFIAAWSNVSDTMSARGEHEHRPTFVSDPARSRRHRCGHGARLRPAARQCTVRVRQFQSRPPHAGRLDGHTSGQAPPGVRLNDARGNRRGYRIRK